MNDYVDTRAVIDPVPVRHDVVKGIESGPAEIAARHGPSGDELHVPEQPLEGEASADRDGARNATDRPGSPTEIAKELAADRRSRAAQDAEDTAAYRRAAGLEEPGTDWREPSQLDRLVEMNPEAAEAARKLVGQEALLEAERQRIKAEGEALLQQARAKLADVERREAEASPAAEVPPEWKQQRAYQYDAWIQQQFPEYGNDAAMRETARTDPERWAQLLYTRQQAERQLQADTFVASEQFKAQAQAQREQFAELAKWDDTQFAKNHPEMENPRVAERVREGIFQMYEEKYNVPRERLKALYKSDPHIRSFAGQEAMLNDWRAWEAQKQMKAGRARPPLPPVQRPGTSGTPVSRQAAEIDSLQNKLNRTGSVRDAARLLSQSRRAANRRGRPLPEEELEDFIKRHANRERREADQIELNSIMRELLEKEYEPFYPPLPSEETKERHKAALKSYREFYGDFEGELRRHGDDLNVGRAPLTAGAVTLYLHCLKRNGATYAELKAQEEALSALATRIEVYDATKSFLVQTLLNAAKQEEKDAQKNSHK